MPPKQRRGSSLLMVVVIMMFAATLTLALLAMAAASTRTQAAARQFDTDYYSAESGLNLAMGILCGVDNPAGQFYPTDSGVSYHTAAARLADFVDSLSRQVADFGAINGQTVEITAELLNTPAEYRCHDGFALGDYAVQVTAVCGARAMTATLRVSPTPVSGDGSGYMRIGRAETVEPILFTAEDYSTSILMLAAQARRTEIRDTLYALPHSYVTVNNAQDAYRHRDAEYLHFGAAYTAINGHAFPNAAAIKTDGAATLTGSFPVLRALYVGGELTIGAGAVLVGGEGAAIYAGNLLESADIVVSPEQDVILRGFDISCRRFRVAEGGGGLITDARVFAESVSGLSSRTLDNRSGYAGQFYCAQPISPALSDPLPNGVFADSETITILPGDAVYRPLPDELRVLLSAAGIGYTGSGNPQPTEMRVDYIAPMYRQLTIDN